MEVIDLGLGYFVSRFSPKEDLQSVLQGGPWFIAGHFLTIRRWRPDFMTSRATLDSVAVWVRLPGLPVEYYDLPILKEIASKIGPVLRIDAHTAAERRGRYARVCVRST